MQLRSQAYEDAQDKHVTRFGYLSIDNEDALDVATLVYSREKALASSVKTLRVRLVYSETILLKLRLLLRQTKELEQLILDLTEISASWSRNLLKYLTFANLDVFSTTMPHDGLLDFLIANSSITNLTLGSCTLRDCPLANIAATELTVGPCRSGTSQLNASG
ncbi:hypothetical protein HGRIS_001190 [Hohenbuehelia grisea]|uniref:Uncharacterized protein n=1 Tax=Hohenbuehelia grisea TaxID=104357 RepID=A0ABR3JNJ6_9AGAR